MCRVALNEVLLPSSLFLHAKPTKSRTRSIAMGCASSSGLNAVPTDGGRGLPEAAEGNLNHARVCGGGAVIRRPDHNHNAADGATSTSFLGGSSTPDSACGPVMGTVNDLLKMKQQYDIYATYRCPAKSEHQTLLRRRNQIAQKLQPLMLDFTRSERERAIITLEMGRLNEMYSLVLKRKRARQVYNSLCRLRKFYKTIPMQTMSGLLRLKNDTAVVLSGMDGLNFPLQPLLEAERLLEFLKDMVAIKTVPFFGACPLDELEHLVKRLVPREYEIGSVIIKRGEPTTKFYIITSGFLVCRQVDVSADDISNDAQASSSNTCNGAKMNRGDTGINKNIDNGVHSNSSSGNITNNNSDMEDTSGRTNLQECLTIKRGGAASGLASGTSADQMLVPTDRILSVGQYVGHTALGLESPGPASECDVIAAGHLKHLDVFIECLELERDHFLQLPVAMRERIRNALVPA